MTAPVKIVNGNGVEMAVTRDQEALVSVSTYPAFRKQKVVPFRQYLTVDGLSSGSHDMGISGAVTNVDFFIPASVTDDRYITNISLILGYGTSAQPFQFADSTALTNGIRFFYQSSSQGEIDIHEGIKSNQDFFRISHSQVTSGWEVRGIGAVNDYGYFITMDLDSFVPPYGIKLDAGTTQRLVMCIRDDCTNADDFSAIAYGFDRFE